MAKVRPGDQAEIELLLDPAAPNVASTEVQLGRAGPSKRRMFLVMALVGAVVLAAASRSTGARSGSTSSVPSTTAASSPSSVAVTAGAVPGVNRAQTPLVSSPPSKVGPMLPFGTPTGVGLYLTRVDQGPPTTFTLYNLDRGELGTIFLGDGIGRIHRAIDGAGGIVVDGGRVVRVQPAMRADLAGGMSNAPTGRVAAGPAGAVWVRDPSAQQLVLFAESGSTGTRYDLSAGADLIGSMADGRPVVRGADQRSYVIEASGTRSLLSSGLTSLIDHGRFTDTTCDDQQHCARVGHLDGQKRGIYLPADVSARFQSDGPWIALVAPDESLTLLNGQTGAEMKVHMTDHVAYEEPGPLGNDGPSVWFLPGGRGVVAITSTGIAFIDMKGEVVGTGPNLGPGITMLGLGTALTNPTR